ncbi:MAG TPA: hypothetical protein IAB01_04475 [Candidatus Avidesulfovibrio excrementigallinarum]|nr:hypothetical protein [Candidatus Avidesulfovibrio excrementigallinarum]
MDSHFDRAHAFTARWEGGFSDHPADTGGVTMYGASLAFVRQLERTADGRALLRRTGVRLPVTAASVRALTARQAATLFRHEFWDRLNLDDLPLRPACVLYDAAVNCGPAQSVRIAQRGYNSCVGPYGVKLVVDGRLGPHSRAALAADTDTIIKAMLKERRRFYRQLAEGNPSQAVFLDGWINRVDALESALLKGAL